MNTDPLSSPAPDTLYYNGVIHTCDALFSTVSVLAVSRGTIVYGGHDPDEGARCLAAGARRLDLEGRTVIPGLIEGHMHFLSQGLNLAEPDIFLRPKDEILDMVAGEAARRGPGAWITGRGWNHDLWPGGTWPDRAELDRVAPSNPVALTRADGHSLWVNSLALAAAGIGDDTPDPHGGEILRRADGTPLGILVDTAIAGVWRAMPAPDEAGARAAYGSAQQELFGYGITSLVNASQTLRNHGYLREGYEAGEILIRVYEMLAAHREEDETYLAAGGKPFTGMYGERLTMRAFKMIGDGSLGSRSAWMLEDYADRPGHRGHGRYGDDELLAMLRRARDNGFQACVHTIGDAAAHQAIRLMATALAERPVPDHRWRIEHFQTVSKQDIALALELGIIPSMQTAHESADRCMAAARLGRRRCAASYAWRRVVDAGGLLVNGSDAPMDKVNPFIGFHAALSRENPEDNLTRQEALRSYTSWAAFGQFSENRTGSLEPGKLADFAVLDRDILTCPLEEVPETRVLLTVSGGRVVHAA